MATISCNKTYPKLCVFYKYKRFLIRLKYAEKNFIFRLESCQFLSFGYNSISAVINAAVYYSWAVRTAEYWQISFKDHLRSKSLREKCPNMELFLEKNSVFGHFSGSVSFFGEFVTPLTFSAQADHEGSYKGNFSLTLILNIFECITIF